MHVRMGFVLAPSTGRHSSRTLARRAVTTSVPASHETTRAPAKPSGSLAALRLCSAPQTSDLRPSHGQAAPVAAKLPQAIIFDCDGVLLESEELHRITYNETFAAEDIDLEWSSEYYEMLQNSVGGGKEKFRYHFNTHGWPSFSNGTFDTRSDDGREQLVNHLHRVKSERYAQLIRSGSGITLRPGVERLIDEALGRGLRLVVCSAANEKSVRLVLDNLLGRSAEINGQRRRRIDFFEFVLAGDVVERKKPDPMIYQMALQRLGLRPDECAVIEDSAIGLQAAIGAHLPCIITRTRYTMSQDFTGAAAIFDSLETVGLDDVAQAWAAHRP